MKGSPTMTGSDSAVTVVDNPSEHRYEARLGKNLAGFSVYENTANSVIVLHTEVAPEYGGHGVGGRLAAGVLDDLRARGLRVTPRCPFIADYIRHHAQYADMVDRDTYRRSGHDE